MEDEARIGHAVRDVLHRFITIGLGLLITIVSRKFLYKKLAGEQQPQKIEKAQE